MKIKSGVLYFVVFILLVVWFICLGILLVFRLNYVVFNIQASQSQRSFDLVSALNYCKAYPDTFSYSQEKKLDLYSDGESEVYITKRTWGLFDLFSIKQAGKNYKRTTNFLFGNDLSKEEPLALYLADEKKYLTICGNSELVGNCYLPKLGIQRGYIDGQAFTGKKTVFGEVKTSDKDLPALKKALIEPVLLRLQNDSVSSSDSMVSFSYFKRVSAMQNSFSNKTLIIQTNADISLDEKRLSGNIIIISTSTIRVRRNCRLNNVIIMAPKISIADGFTGTLQAFASDSLIIGKKCTLLYPSVVAIMNENINNCYMQIMEKTNIHGIVLVQQEKKAQKLPEIRIAEGAILFGQVYCNGVFNLKGSVNGALYCKRFVLETKSAFYENHLLNNKINRIKLSKQFGGMVIGSIKNTNSLIIEQLK